MEVRMDQRGTRGMLRGAIFSALLGVGTGAGLGNGGGGL